MSCNREEMPCNCNQLGCIQCDLNLKRRRESGQQDKKNKNSLSYLTSQFIFTLLRVHNGQMDLNLGSQILHVHKRRLYDITNALEGVGILTKRQKNIIMYNGNNFQQQRHEVLAEQLFDLYKTLSQEIRMVNQSEKISQQLDKNLLKIERYILNMSKELRTFYTIIQPQIPVNFLLFGVNVSNCTEFVLSQLQNDYKQVIFIGESQKPKIFLINKNGERVEAEFEPVEVELQKKEEDNELKEQSNL